MNKIFYLKLSCITFIISSSAFAQLSIGYTKANNLILRSESCEELVEQNKAICLWRKTNEPSFIVPNITKSKCVNNSRGTKSIVVSSCLPKIVKSNHRKKLYKDGPNCWGTALSFKENSTKPRFVWEKEILYWMDSPVCKKLEVGEEKKPGDILNIYGPEYIFDRNHITKGSELYDVIFPGHVVASPVATGYSGFHNFLHSETYLSSKLSFGKESPNKDDRFNFNPIGEVYGRPRSEKCQELQSIVPNRREFNNKPQDIQGSACPYFSLAYRCQNIRNFLKSLSLSDEDKTLLDEAERLDLINKELFKFQRNSQYRLTSQKIKNYLSIADSISDDSLYKLSLKPEKNTEMVLVYRYFTAEGIRKAIEQAELTPPTEEL